MIEQTLGLIKPDAVAAGKTGDIIKMIEENGFIIDRLEKGILKKEHAENFYEIHKEKPFFGELVEFITSGPLIVLALRKDNAVEEWRKLMGATDPQKAADGSIRKKYGTNIGKNAVHGSDSLENAKKELMLFFGEQ
ncbi:TPA: nucleoside-diphosphate kinase [Candidatus Dependentiae bacterium]|nr:MAG: Nucleoside diphosphate kinase [candidate division TM6 bacterium GW2011_GWF2_36_131]KKQ03686.1 MAG: Nucleoside diphosphate kinase [candidate division TM6 bacterium GW2011_GWE2_36_25]KKQ20078.1 MAG: Nucleoside diphosphate kinase [candidate division TM6 bacterium GW2011_GWA2_36_9]HBR70453.1 nucleoside-diphosphate kinase [Candidatus Dependentiae bacterium]HCU00831.1 nucleoside-diphosphate kinase [Candidatus Dependentiae bacterium]